MQPLFYAALAMAAGIAAAAGGPAWLAPPAAAWLGGAFASTALAAAVLDRRWIAAALGLAFCFAAGFARARHLLLHPAPPSALAVAADRLQPKPRDRIFLTGYLRDTPELLYDDGRPGAVRLDLEAATVARAADAQDIIPVSGGVRLYAYPPNPADTHGWAGPLLALGAGEGLAASVHLRPLRSYHDPGVADFTASDRRQGLVLTATLPDQGWRIWPSVRGGRAAAARARLWRWLSRHLDTLAPPATQPRANALLRGMLLGDVARLDEATRTNFQVDGVYHLLVVAGLHIGVLAAFLWWLLRLCRLPRFAAGGLSLLLLAGYAWTIAGRTPTERALLMLAIYLGARYWYRERQALNAVGAAGLLLLTWHPLDLFAPGFQMSFGAATLLAGVALPVLLRTSHPLRRATRRLGNPAADEAFPPRLAQWRLDLRALATRLGWIWHALGWRAMPMTLRGLLGVYEVAVISLVLQLGFAAFNVVYFHRANPWSVAANALLVPMASLLIPLAWAGVAVTAATRAAPAAHAAGWLVAGLARWVLWTADAMARWPGAGARVPSPPGWFLILFAFAAAAWLAACLGHAGRWRLLAAASAAMAALWVVLALAPFAPRLPPGLTATVLDVGQGDSIFVSFPDGRTLLVDGGPRSPHWDTGDEVIAPFLWSLGLHRLDAVLLTHGHNDHLGGLDTVVADFRASEVWVTRTLPPEPAVAEFLRRVAASGARLRRLDAGDVFLAGASRLQILLPPPSYQTGEIASNDDSMVVRVTWKGASMLLEGDAQAGGERWMVDHGLPLASALLKVGHHGSHTSSTQDFLAAVHPRVAVISVGLDNVYGLPAADVVTRLEQDGARVFRTDQDGAIQCRLENGQLQVYLFRRIPST